MKPTCDCIRRNVEDSGYHMKFHSLSDDSFYYHFSLIVLDKTGREILKKDEGWLPMNYCPECGLPYEEECAPDHPTEEEESKKHEAAEYTREMLDDR